MAHGLHLRASVIESGGGGSQRADAPETVCYRSTLVVGPYGATMRLPNQTKFPLGRIVAAQNALDSIQHNDIQEAFERHSQGNWGDLNEHDLTENEEALVRGNRILLPTSPAVMSASGSSQSTTDPRRPS